MVFLVAFLLLGSRREFNLITLLTFVQRIFPHIAYIMAENSDLWNCKYS